MRTNKWIKQIGIFALVTIPCRLISLECKILNLFGMKAPLNRIAMNICQLYEKYDNFYVALKYRPKYAEQISSIETYNPIDKKIAIIIQGPLITKDHFTLETVRLYKKIFPAATIIISTWLDSDKQEINLLNQDGHCIVLQNPMPQHRGFLNINLQCCSTMYGIKKARELGCEYIFKTRGDYRFYAKGSLCFLYNLLLNYPCEDNKLGQKYRIITGDVATEETAMMFYPYFLTDTYTFGHIDDMEKYWDIELSELDDFDKKKVNDLIRNAHWTWKERNEKNLIAETYIVRNYIKRQEGRYPELSVEKYWDYIKKYFIVVPKSLLNAYDIKYNERRFNETTEWGLFFAHDSPKRCLTYNFDFVEWLNLYHNTLEYKSEYEEFQNTKY